MHFLFQIFLSQRGDLYCFCTIHENHVCFGPRPHPVCSQALLDACSSQSASVLGGWGPRRPRKSRAGQQQSVSCFVSRPQCQLCAGMMETPPRPPAVHHAAGQTLTRSRLARAVVLCVGGEDQERWPPGPGGTTCPWQGQCHLPAAGVHPLIRGQLKQAHAAARRTGSPSTCHREGWFFSLGQM